MIVFIFDPESVGNIRKEIVKDFPTDEFYNIVSKEHVIGTFLPSMKTATLMIQLRNMHTPILLRYLTESYTDIFVNLSGKLFRIEDIKDYLDFNSGLDGLLGNSGIQPNK